jgi:hypothetical protein
MTFTARILGMVMALAAIPFVGTAAAQSPSLILNTVELRKLVDSAQPADHARLSAHFAALADRYAAEARRHTAMASSYAGNPNRNRHEHEHALPATVLAQHRVRSDAPRIGHLSQDTRVGRLLSRTSGWCALRGWHRGTGSN